MDNNTEMNNNAETVEEVKEAEDTAKKPEEKKSSFLSDVIEIMESTLIMVFVIVLVVTYLLHPVNIIGLSMYPTLNKHYDASDPNSISDRIFMRGGGAGKPQGSSRGRPGFRGTLWVASRVPSALSTSKS